MSLIGFSVKLIAERISLNETQHHIFRWSLSRTFCTASIVKNQWNVQAFLLYTTNAITYNQVHSHDSQFYCFSHFPRVRWCRTMQYGRNTQARCKKTNWSFFLQHSRSGLTKMRNIMNVTDCTGCTGCINKHFNLATFCQWKLATAERCASFFGPNDSEPFPLRRSEQKTAIIKLIWPNRRRVIRVVISAFFFHFRSAKNVIIAAVCACARKT